MGGCNSIGGGTGRVAASTTGAGSTASPAVAAASGSTAGGSAAGGAAAAGSRAAFLPKLGSLRVLAILATLDF